MTFEGSAVVGNDEKLEDNITELGQPEDPELNPADPEESDLSEVPSGYI